jgi:beta-lactamase class A
VVSGYFSSIIFNCATTVSMLIAIRIQECNAAATLGFQGLCIIAKTNPMQGTRFIFFFLLIHLLSACAAGEGEAPLEALEGRVRAEFARSSGVFALAFLDLEDGARRLLINDTVTFHAASTMKTPVMIEVFKQAAEGRFTLEDSLSVKNEFHSIVDSSLYSLSLDDDSEEKLYDRIGEQAAIRDLVYDMIVYSSNLATNILIDWVGAENTTRAMRDMGAARIMVRRGLEDGKAYALGLNNTTSAADLLVIFEKLGQGTVVSPEASQSMIDILLDQQFKDVIPALLPPEVKVAHKTGWISTARHDSGLVFLPDGRRYVLVLLSKNWESDELATEVLTKVSRMVYDFYLAYARL